LEKEGEVQRIKEEVDWNLEAGAMLRRSCEQSLPAPFFEKVKDYSEGYSLFGGILSSYKRIAIAMDMDASTQLKELMAEYLKRKGNPIIYVSVPRLRENVCEILKISRRRFDLILLEIWKRNTHDVELASGPLTSRSRTAPTRKLSIYVDRKAAVLSPEYILEAEEGLNVGGKKFQTIAFHRRD